MSYPNDRDNQSKPAPARKTSPVATVNKPLEFGDGDAPGSEDSEYKRVRAKSLGHQAGDGGAASAHTPADHGRGRTDDYQVQHLEQALHGKTFGGGGTETAPENSPKAPVRNDLK